MNTQTIVPQSSSVPDLSALFSSAEGAGILSTATAGIINIDDIGTQINAAWGVGVEDTKTSEQILVSMLIDDSSSIGSAGNEDSIRLGHNSVIDALNKINDTQKESILIHCRYINGKILYPYSLLKDASIMDNKNYMSYGSTPLYERAWEMLNTIVAKCQDFEDNAGCQCRSISLIVTDGASTDNQQATRLKNLRQLIEDMLRRECHIIAGMGIDDGYTDFRKIFSEMGIPDKWILTPKSDPSEIRACFELFSRSASSASQSPGSFSQTAMGGFGN